jgi:hypothetical protein
MVEDLPDGCELVSRRFHVALELIAQGSQFRLLGRQLPSTALQVVRPGDRRLQLVQLGLGRRQSIA